MTTAELLRHAIELSGLSNRAFAMRVVARDVRQVRRWLSGSKMSKSVETWLASWVALPEEHRMRIVRAIRHAYPGHITSEQVAAAKTPKP